MKQPLSDQRIIESLNTNYGIKVARLTFLPLGADLNASVYKAEARDKSSYFIKLKRGHHHDNVATTLKRFKHKYIKNDQIKRHLEVLLNKIMLSCP